MYILLKLRISSVPAHLCHCHNSGEESRAQVYTWCGFGSDNKRFFQDVHEGKRIKSAKLILYNWILQDVVMFITVLLLIVRLILLLYFHCIHNYY